MTRAVIAELYLATSIASSCAMPLGEHAACALCCGVAAAVCAGVRVCRMGAWRDVPNSGDSAVGSA